MLLSTDRFETNSALIEHLIDAGVLKSPPIIDAFRVVNRAYFVLEDYRDDAYVDAPLPIGQGQTISQPYTVAFMLELLQPQIGQHILDIGSGSGWTTALLGHIVGKTGSVIGLEIVLELITFGQNNIAKYPDLNIKIKPANEKLGIPDQTFDRILVSAETDKMPMELIKQLNKKGKMVIPINRSLILVEKDQDGQVQEKEIPGFVFVPLIEPTL